MNQNKAIELSVVMNGALREARTCSIHGDYSALVLASGHVSPCPLCFERELEKEAIVVISAQREQNERASAHSRIARTGIPGRYLSQGLNNYRVKHSELGQLDALNAVREYVKQFPCEKGRSLGLVGSTGTGKTHLACAAGMEIMRKGYSVRFVSVLTLLRAVKSTYSPGSMITEADAIESFCLPDLLIMDDVGVKLESETDRSIIYEVVSQRNLDGKSMIYTSNLLLDTLRESVGDRVISRLCENNGEILLCQWPDYRFGGAE